MNKIALLIILSFVLISCKVEKPSSTKNESPLFTIDNNEILKDDFKYAFLKNYRPSDSLTVEEEVREYLKLYVNFKLKVLAAKELGYHERESYINELNKYQKDLAKPYLTETKITEELVDETYKRLQYEIKASHILIESREGSSPADTLKAYNKAKEIRELASNGAPFDSLARVYSSDPSAKTNGGNLGYFTGMQMVYPFETAAYNTEVGDISEIVKTRFGYHIIQMEDKRKARGKVKVAHLMIRTPSNQSENEAIASKSKIDAIYKELQNGESWINLVNEYSEDPGSKNKGGELPWFGTGNFVPEFEEVAFAMDSTNQLSKPFKTVYGWHIVKLIDKKDIAPLEEMRGEIEKKIGRDSRSSVKQQATIDRLKRENGFKLNAPNKKQLLDSLELLPNDAVLFTIGEKDFKVSDFIPYTEGIKASQTIEQEYNQFETKSILDYENVLLESKYPEYRALINEYREGILLFDVMEDKVWQKASTDTVGLKDFFSTNIENYIKKDVAIADIYTSRKETTISNVDSLLDAGFSKKKIESQLNEKEPLNLQVRSGLFESGENLLVDQNREPGTYTYNEGEKFYLVNVKQVVEEKTPTLDDIKGKVISDYQDFLETSWISALKDKYTVSINDASLKTVINEIEEQVK